MDAYPDPYLDDAYALIVLSGLASTPVAGDGESVLPRNGLRLDGQQPLIEHDHAQRILAHLQQLSPSSSTPRQASRSHIPPMRFQPCDRSFTFPTRKSSPQATPAGSSIDQFVQPSSAASELHSPLSPLSPGSTLYPDGLMTPLWMQKHSIVVPAQIISFFTLSNDKSRQTIHDNDLKAEINLTKTRLDDSRYRTRYGVVIVGRESLEDNAALEDRLASIRKTVKLDTKTPTFFYISMLDDDKDMMAGISSIFEALWPATSEYYRDLTRHARRKRDRSNAPISSPPTTPGVSQNLTRPGWNARYEFKLGVFADFRREPDVAARHYATALDHIFHPMGFFEVMSNWSPRWNEARMFADVVAIRLLRCHLLNERPTSATMFWTSYRSRLADVLAKNAKGIDNYGWRAWEARWSQIMAELLQRYGLPPGNSAPPSQNLDDNTPEAWTTVYLSPEKQVLSEDPLRPWEFLHHAGYWFGIALGYVRARRRLACNIPEGDRLPAGQSPAAAVARRAEAYDTYLCPEPDEESKGLENGNSIHDLISVRLLHEAVRSFSAHQQKRMADAYKVALGKQLAAVKSREEALRVLKSVWEENDWRRGQWAALIKDLTLVLHVCAREAHDTETEIATMWELLDDRLPPVEGLDYDLGKIISSAQESDTKVVIDGSRIGSFVSLHCLFEKTQTNAGEPTQLRIILQSHAKSHTPPVTLSSLVLGFEGVTDRIVLNHEKHEVDSDTTLLKAESVTLSDISESLNKIAGSTFQGSADLEIAPGQVKVWLTSMTPRDAGRIKYQSCMMRIQAGSTRIDYRCTDSAGRRSTPSKLVPALRCPGPKLSEIEVLPRPPKLEIDLSQLERVYYTDETAIVPVHLRNGEGEGIMLQVQLVLISGNEDGFSVKWQDSNDPVENSNSTSLAWDVGKMDSNSTESRALVMKVPAVTADTALEIKASYFLVSDPNTPITKILTSDSIVVRPFEANYMIRPLLHPEPWPNFFWAPSLASQEAVGIKTRWELTASMVSFASQDVVIKDIRLEIVSATADARIQVLGSDKEPNEAGELLAPKQQKLVPFTIDVQKSEIDERRTISCSARLVISWKRASSSEQNPTVSILEVGKVGFASAEPRVLCTRLASRQEASLGTVVQFMVENPSMHYLSFNIELAASKLFAFSGPRSSKLSVLPMSRQAVQYTVVCTEEDLEEAQQVATSPRSVLMDMSVVDVYFNKRLEVLAAEPGVQEERDGLISVLA